MTKTVDYYFSLNSPWTYLGHERLIDTARRSGATIRPHVVDFTATIFARTGGVPVAKRSPQRQAYRLQELERWRNHLGIDLTIKPAFWPADEQLAAAIVLVLRDNPAYGVDSALRFAGSVLRCVWAENRDMGDENTLRDLLAKLELPADSLVEQARNERWLNIRVQETEQAIDLGVFGAPSYLIDDQVYWGQDRLDFVARQLENCDP